MESQHQKWVNISYLALAILVGYIVFSGGMKISGTYDLEARVRNIELLMRILSIVCGALLFLFLYKHEKSNQFMNEVVVELSRVTWPTQKETTSATIVVIIFVIISGLVLGLFDYIWTVVMKNVL